MSRYFSAILILSLTSTYCFSHDAQDAPLNAKQRRQSKKLEQLYKRTSSEFEGILKELQELKKAKPAEFTYYLANLKIAIIKALETRTLTISSDFMTTEIEAIKWSRKPLSHFKESILPRTIGGISRLRKILPHNSFTQEVDEILEQLRSIGHYLA